MGLTALDESLMHQVAVPFQETTVSDHRFFDRMFLGGHCANNIKVISGMAAYKNMNAFDGFLSVMKDGRQHNLRVSRPFLPDAGELAVGPLRLEIVKPLEQVRMTLAPGKGYSHSADLLFSGISPVHEEAPHVRRVDGRLQQDFRRFDQIGKLKGWIAIDGERIDLSDWFGIRDHSWGVRPNVGGYEPVTTLRTSDKLVDPAVAGHLFVWLAFEAGDTIGQFQHHEDGNGTVWMTDGSIRKGNTEVAVRSVAHEIEFVPGTRVFRSAHLDIILADGERVEIEAEALLSPWCYKGTGYDHGWDDEEGLGFHRGIRQEADIYDVTHAEDVILPDGRTIRPWHREQPVKLTVNGVPGLGHFPIINRGLIRRYGLDQPQTNRKNER